MQRKATYEVDRSKAPMADLPQVCEELLGILPEEQLSHLRVLQAPGPHTRRHGQRLVIVVETNWVSICYLEELQPFVLGTWHWLLSALCIINCFCVFIYVLFLYKSTFFLLTTKRFIKQKGLIRYMQFTY